MQLHPCTDEWMQGDHYGVIKERRVRVVGRTARAPSHNEYKVKLDVSGKNVWFHEDNILHEGNDEHEAMAGASRDGRDT